MGSKFGYALLATGTLVTGTTGVCAYNQLERAVQCTNAQAVIERDRTVRGLSSSDVQAQVFRYELAKQNYQNNAALIIATGLLLSSSLYASGFACLNEKPFTNSQ